MIRIVNRYSIALCRENPNEIFVFGDNIQRCGRGGQAIIRYEPNAFGIATKVSPSMWPSAFFSDQPGQLATIKADIMNLKKLSYSHVLVFPSKGIGTGLAQMSQRSPKAFELLNELLLKEFGYNNAGINTANAFIW